MKISIEMITSTINLVFFFSLILVLIYLLYGGIQWLGSGGDFAATESARGRITGAIVGLIIIAIAFAIYQIISAFVA